MKIQAQRLLLTGATGIVGCEILRSLLHSPNPPEILLLLRGSDTEVIAKRRWLLKWSEAPAGRADLLRCIRGDTRRPGLGLNESDRSAARTVTRILHAGAVTGFDQTREDAYLNNVVGTNNVIEHGRHCPQIERIGIVSTVFVAGRRVGIIREDELDLNVHFNNEYERSKAVAERDAKLAMPDLPLDIYRLSIVVGRRSDGHISRLSGIYPIFRLFYEGLLAMVPGVDGQTVDLIPSDFAAAAMCFLVSGSLAPGMTYHICAGAHRSFQVNEVFPAIDAWLAASDPQWTRHGRPIPLVVGADIFARFVDVVELTGDRRLRQIIRHARRVTRQLETAKVYDTHGFDGAMAGSGVPPLPHVSEWLPTIVARGRETGWRQPARYTLI
jgi:nucleoside-diphosphate-sugar epimerase